MTLFAPFDASSDAWRLLNVGRKRGFRAFGAFDAGAFLSGLMELSVLSMLKKTNQEQRRSVRSEEMARKARKASKAIFLSRTGDSTRQNLREKGVKSPGVIQPSRVRPRHSLDRGIRRPHFVPAPSVCYRVLGFQSATCFRGRS
jgi:hypothetical protein